MIEKAKRQPKNFFRYFFDEFILFRRDFYFEIEAEPEIVVEKIRALHYENTQTYERKIITELNQFEDSWQFELIAKRASKGTYSQNAKAKGEITVEADGKTILQGSAILGGFYYQFFALMLMVGAFYYYWMFFRRDFTITKGTEFAVMLMVIMIAFFLGLALFLWLRMLNDRNHLYNLIQSVVESANGNDNEAQAS